MTRTVHPKDWLQGAGFDPGRVETMAQELSGMIGGYIYDANSDRTELLWKCLACGELKPRNRWVLGDCPACGVPKSQFVLVDED